MITALTALLVLVSLALVVTVPVALATPGEWESSKDQFNKAFQLWGWSCCCNRYRRWYFIINLVTLEIIV